MASQKYRVGKKRERIKPYWESERQFMAIMKARGIKLVPYPQKFYVSDCGRPTTYTPDFWEKGTNRYYEVTNKSACYEANKRKYASFREMNPDLELLNVRPTGEVYVHKGRKPVTPYKEKTYYNAKFDEIYTL